MSYTKHQVGDIVGEYKGILIKPVSGQKWETKCHCNALFIKQVSQTNGLCPACNRQRQYADRVVHGDSKNTALNKKLYNIWLSMRSRCNSITNKNYKDYGARGIYVVSNWDDYIVFKDWALQNGYAPGLTLDRIDTNGPYSDTNCRWVIRKIQANNVRRNKLLVFNNRTQTLAQWCTELNLPYHTIKNRLNLYHWSVEKALTEPIQNKLL